MKKIVSLLLLCVLSVAGLWAKGSQENIDRPLPDKPVKIAVLNGPSGIGLIQLKEKSPFADPAVTADVQVMGAPKVLLGQMLKEEWDAAVLPANMAAILYNKGVGYKSAAVTGMGNLYLVGKKELSSLSLEQIAAKTIHIPGKNTTPDLITQLVAEKKGFSADLDYSFNPSDLAKALVGGVAEMAVLPEPLVSVALKQSKGALEILFDMQDLWKAGFGEESYPMTVLVVKSSFAESWPGLTEELLDATGASLDWVVSEPAAASALIKDHGFTLPPPIVQQAIPRTNYVFASGEQMEAMMTPYFERIKGLNPGAVGGSVPESAFYLK